MRCEYDRRKKKTNDHVDDRTDAESDEGPFARTGQLAHRIPLATGQWRGSTFGIAAASSKFRGARLARRVVSRMASLLEHDVRGPPAAPLCFGDCGIEKPVKVLIIEIFDSVGQILWEDSSAWLAGGERIRRLLGQWFTQILRREKVRCIGISAVAAHDKIMLQPDRCGNPALSPQNTIVFLISRFP